MSQDADFIEAQGPAFAAHLFTRLADDLVEAARRWYAECGVEAPPRTSSTLIALAERGPLGVTELSGLLRQSHQLVRQWVHTLKQLGLARTASDRADARRTLVSLTPKGRREVERLRLALTAIDEATRQWVGETHPTLLAALWRLDRSNRERPFLERVRAAALNST